MGLFGWLFGDRNQPQKRKREEQSGDGGAPVYNADTGSHGGRLDDDPALESPDALGSDAAGPSYGDGGGSSDAGGGGDGGGGGGGGD